MEDEVKETATIDAEDVLTQEPEEVAMFSTPKERKIALRMAPVIQAKAIKLARAEAEASKAKELQKFIEELTASNKEILDKKIEEFRKALTPPTPDELQALLQQEYAEFTLKIKAGSVMRDFVIRELPMAAEGRIMKMVNKTLQTRLQEVSLIDWKSGTSLIERVVKLCEMIPGAMETLADCCAVSLNPTGEDTEITGDWVRTNLGMSRIVAIVTAQMEAGRYRDFLSHVSRLFPTGMMT